MKNSMAWMSVFAIILSISAISIYNDYSYKKQNKVSFRVDTNIEPVEGALDTYKYNPSIVINEFMEKIDTIEFKNSDNTK